MADQLTDTRSYRLSNIDMMRGLVIIIMAIDHVRDYFYFSGGGVSISSPDIDAAYYITRWITHFCAPVFVFLAGTSVGLMSGRRSQNEIAKFVFKRGVWLIFCEIVLISTGLTFSPFGEAAVGGNTVAFMQILWALGVSMIVLSGALFLGPRTCLMIGIAIIAGHNLLDPIWPTGNPFGDGTDAFWATLHSPGSIMASPFFFMMLYPPIPWIGVILMRFGRSHIFRKEAGERDNDLRKIGISFVAAFIILRFINIYGDQNLWQTQELGALSTFFDFMDVSKYPPSLLFALATLGPMAIVCSYADRWNGWLKDTLVMFGRVPFAFYVVHFYLIHTLSVLFGMYQGLEAGQMMHFFPFYPKGFGTNIMGVYIAWAVVMIIMYPFCKWMYNIKKSRKNWWLSYL